MAGRHRSGADVLSPEQGPAAKESIRERTGPGAAIGRVLDRARKVAPTGYTVLITGETGSGKELVARSIHTLSRRNGPFVPVDCGSIPASLIEDELFGHERGAFTGADRGTPGKFEAAQGGTLFLDEISNLPLDLQPKLLRALQERQVTRLGGSEPVDLDLRVVAASNRDLGRLVAGGRFRRDLYHRLNEIDLVVPPLRDRQDDIPFLAERFLRQAAEELRKPVVGFSEAALETLLAYRWPGNVRELRNAVRRAALLADGTVQPRHLGLSTTGPAADTSWLYGPTNLDECTSLKEAVRRTVRCVERRLLREALRQTEGNKAQAARILRIDYKTIHKKLKEYDLSPI
ncbi:MAG: sigma-54 dependent transcriptional regulator [Phycisphaerae bacterium]